MTLVISFSGSGTLFLLGSWPPYIVLKFQQMSFTTLISSVNLCAQKTRCGPNCTNNQRWASTHANRSNARLRLKTLPSIGRSNRSSFYKKLKILVAPSISMFKKIYCRFLVIDFYPSKFLLNDRALYRDFRPSIIDFFDHKPSISFIWGIKMRRILSPFQI